MLPIKSDYMKHTHAYNTGVVVIFSPHKIKNLKLNKTNVCGTHTETSALSQNPIQTELIESKGRTKLEKCLQEKCLGLVHCKPITSWKSKSSRKMGETKGSAQRHGKQDQYTV